MFGPSVFPYQPRGVWDIPYTDKWVESPGEDRYRRAVYTFMRRSAPYPSMVTSTRPAASTAPCAERAPTRRSRL